jgi:3-vinyl bacteriochlorophyllide hydratase
MAADGRGTLRNSVTPCKPTRNRLYSADERVRRDETYWTVVQGILAPVQFAAFAVSLGLVLHYLLTGEGYTAATVSILIKTLLLYTIMVTGAIWEKVVFGQYLFAPAFFWEDVFSFAVVGLHTWYLVGLLTGWLSPQAQMLVALAAYVAYFVNAGQFLWKLRMARAEADAESEADDVRRLVEGSMV